MFGPTSGQKDIFDNIVNPLIAKFLNNESCILFAYGMTNAGKTYTIQGTQNDPGIIPMLIEKILNKTINYQDRCLSLSMIEIYNNEIYDLNIKDSKPNKTNLDLRYANGKIDINQLTSNHITCVSDAIKLFDKASANRYIYYN